MSEPRELTSKELLSLAETHGYDVTDHKLARWRHEGLLQSPEQRALGRGRGTQTVYPPGTSEQLLALCAIHDHERRLDYVAWYLWWADYDVSLDRIRSFISSVTVEWDRHAPELMDPRRGPTDAGYKMASRAARERLGQPLSGVRRRVGKERFGIFLSVLLEAISGAFDRFSVEITGNSKEDERGIVERGLGLKQADAVPGLEMDIEACLRSMGWLTGKGSLQKELGCLTDEQLLEARNEVRSWLALLGGYGLMFESWLGKWGPFGLVSAMGRMVRDMGAQEQALWTLVWAIARYRGPADLRKGLKAHGRPTPEMETGLRDWERLARLRQEVPALSRVLTPQRIKQGFGAASRGPQELEHFEKELDEESRRIAKSEE